MNRVNVSLSSGNFQFILGSLILSGFQCKHLHLFFKCELFWHRNVTALLQLLLLGQSPCSGIPADDQNLKKMSSNPIENKLPVNFLSANNTWCGLHLNAPIVVCFRGLWTLLQQHCRRLVDEALQK